MFRYVKKIGKEGPIEDWKKKTSVDASKGNYQTHPLVTYCEENYDRVRTQLSHKVNPLSIIVCTLSLQIAFISLLSDFSTWSLKWKFWCFFFNAVKSEGLELMLESQLEIL